MTVELPMRIISFSFIFVLLITGHTTARDFLVEFVEENYKETRVRFAYDPLIYHSIQINSDAGPKMIILTGQDHAYRKWLRYYMAENRHFILKIDPPATDRFIASKVFKTNLLSIHPYEQPDAPSRQTSASPPKTLKGDNYFLVVDTDETRTKLLQSVSKKMGFDTLSFKDKNTALRFFLLHPEKFKMVVIHHTMPVTGTDMIDKVLSIKHNIPILVETGYGNRAGQQALISKYSDHSSVHIKPVILSDLQKTIKNVLLNTNA